MTLAAQLLRENDLDASPASVIEAIRLADALASLRDRSVAGLDELLEATESVLCGGNRTPLELIARKLVVGERLGTIPEVTVVVVRAAALAAATGGTTAPAIIAAGGTVVAATSVFIGATTIAGGP